MDKGWKLITYKKGVARASPSPDSHALGQCLLPTLAKDKVELSKRLDAIKRDISESEEYQPIRHRFAHEKFDELFCVGLGCFSRDLNSLQQLAIAELMFRDGRRHGEVSDDAGLQSDDGLSSGGDSIVVVEPLLSALEIDFLQSRRFHANPIAPTFVSDCTPGSPFGDAEMFTSFLPASSKQRFVFAPHCPKAIAAALAVRLCNDKNLLALMNELRNYPDLAHIATKLQAEEVIDLDSSKCKFADALHALSFQRGLTT